MEVHADHELRHHVQPVVEQCKRIAEKFGCKPEVKEDDVSATSYSENIFISEQSDSWKRGLTNFRIGYSQRRKLRIMIQAKRNSHLHKVLGVIPFFGESHDNQITKASYVYWAWYGQENVSQALDILGDLANMIEP